MAAFVYFWSSAYEVSGGCATDTVYPSFLRMLATASQPEPSAKAPCTRTTFLICCVMTILLCSKDDPVGPFDVDVERLRAKPLLSCARDVSGYWLMCAELAASSISLAVSFGWDM